MIISALQKKIITLIGIVFLLGGFGVGSVHAQAASDAGTYYIYLTNADTTNVSATVSSKFANFSSCMTDQKSKLANTAYKLAVTCNYYSSKAQADNVATRTAAAIKNNIEKKAGEKVLASFKCGGLGFDIIGCIPKGVYYLIYKPTQYFLIGTGYMFDIMLNLSIRKEFVSDPPFIEISWKVVRDFSNMVFIFVLLYTGIATMLGTPGWAKTVRNVVVIALLINFSLFFTKVVIDAGNILAVGVYESIKAGSPSISEGIAKGFEPQSFLGATNVDDAMDAIVVFLLAAVISGYAGYIFLKAALLFLGRLIAFWFLMIVSPFAFISITLPKGNVFSQWWGILLNQTFVAPVYLFLLYLIMQIVGTGILGGTQMTGSWLFDKLLTPIIMGALILMAMQKALSLAEKMSGDFGKLGASMAGAVVGVAGGVALGGTAIAGRAIGGKIAAKAFEGGTMQRWAASEKTGLLGAAQRNLGMRGTMALDSARSASWDARSVGLVSKGMKATGVDVGKAGGKGGYVQGQKDWVKEQKKKAASMEMTDGEKKAMKDVVRTEAEEALTSATLQEKVATENLTAQMKAYTDAQKANDESETTKAKNVAGVEYEEAVRNRMKGGTPESVDEAKAKFEAAEAANNASPEFVATTIALAKLNVAQESRAKAVEGVISATKTEGDLAAKIADNIKKENERRRGAYAEQVTQGIPTSRVARATGTTLGTENLSEARAKKIAAIRAGKSDEDKKKEDEATLLKEIAKKIKEAEGGEH